MPAEHTFALFLLRKEIGQLYLAIGQLDPTKKTAETEVCDALNRIDEIGDGLMTLLKSLKRKKRPW